MYSTPSPNPNPNPNPNTNTNTIFIITPPPETTIVNTTPPPYPPANCYKTDHGATTSSGTTTSRDYRKGNWTLEETLLLIKAKKLDNERRANNNNNSRGGELRWKWIENYCWNNGCFRSQNQCNDKWDNLLRDYKKVREYVTTYWSMDKNERKYRNLPSNMLLEIYQELNQVVEMKNVIIHTHHQQQQPPPNLEVLAPPLPTTLPADTSAESSETQGEDQGEKVDMETKRRRVRDIKSSILHSNTLLSQTLKHYDGKREKRHCELMELEQQRLHLEETRNEVNRQGIAGLLASVKKLSDAIHALISEN